MNAHSKPRRRTRRSGGLALGAGAAAFAACLAGSALADSSDGIFPTADEVGGEVFPQGLQVGEAFPTDWTMYDEDGNQVNVGELLGGKRSVLAFFISAVPTSVAELKKLQEASAANGGDAQVLFINADTVGTALLGGPGSQIRETVRTVSLIKREQGIDQPMFVAPNDVLSPMGLSNRLGFRGLPTVFVVDARGKVEQVYVGPQDWSKTSI